ncbi:MAG: restriction endonuclease subunit S [Cytophagia bacterium]|nr:restriction endonuclease subunit S [Cytophagia bacterium]
MSLSSSRHSRAQGESQSEREHPGVVGNPEHLITEILDIWTSAIKNKATTGRGSNKKQELYGIKKLRELILELAVRGLLVPQDPNDEPASVLLEKIATEKEQLVRDKKIKKPKKLSPIGEKEMLFELPSGWQWARLQDVSEYIQRGKGPKYADSGRVKVISQKCIQSSGFNIEPARFVEGSSLEKYQPERFLQDNDLLWNSTGTGTVGRVNVIRDVEPESLVADSHVTVIRTIKMDTGFLWSYIFSPGIQSRMEHHHDNALVSGSTKQVELNTSSVTSLMIPVPPEAEQPRIVAKVEELMALCDQLEQQTESSLNAHQTLVETLLKALLDAAQSRDDASAFEQAWQRIADHFDVLFTTEHSIDQLKQTILQLAVMGKLVPQDPNDEPASELLKKIKAEKEKLIKEGKIKKQKPLPPISDEEKPFELPEGWEWCRLGEIVVLQGGFAYKSTHFTETGDNQVVRMGNIRPDFLRLNEKSVFISDELAESTQDYQIKEQDILMTMTGTKGKRDYLYSVMVTAEDLRAVNLFLNQRLCIARPIFVSAEFLNTVLKDDRLLDLVFAKSTGTANQANIGMGAIQNWVIPVPPQNLQKHIVDKKEELVSLCSSLSEHILDAQKVQFHLADAMAEQALSQLCYDVSKK